MEQEALEQCCMSCAWPCSILWHPGRLIQNPRTNWNPGPSSQSYGFSSSHVQVWELDHKEGWSESCSVTSKSLWPHELYSLWSSPGQNTGVGIRSLLQGILPTQGWNPGFPHCRQILYQLSHKGSPRILEWVAYPFSSGSSRPRNWTWVFCIVGRVFTNWAVEEARGWGVKTQPPKPNLVKVSYWWKHLHLTVGIQQMSTFSRSCALLGSSKNLEPIFEYSRPNLISVFL